jgi:hypothetical protein
MIKTHGNFVGRSTTKSYTFNVSVSSTPPNCLPVFSDSGHSQLRRSKGLSSPKSGRALNRLISTLSAARSGHTYNCSHCVLTFATHRSHFRPSQTRLKLRTAQADGLVERDPFGALPECDRGDPGCQKLDVNELANLDPRHTNNYLSVCREMPN